MRIRSVKLAALIGGLVTGLLTLGPATAAPNQNRGGDEHFMVNTRVDTVDANPGDGECADTKGRCSLRAAVQEANASPGADVIRLKRSMYRLTLAGAGEDLAATGDLDVTSEILIKGNRSTVDANRLDRAFDVLSGGELWVQNLTITGGAPPPGESGGAFRNSGKLLIQGSHITNNTVEGAGASGGGVINDLGKLIVRASSLRNNSAERAGGGIEANEGMTRLNNSELLRNTTGPTPGNGGGLHLTGAGTVKVGRTLVAGNSADLEGGGLWNSSTGTMDVSHSVIRNNRAKGDLADEGGGGLFNDGGSLTVGSSKIRHNRANGDLGSGGGILNNLGELTVRRSDIENNTAKRAGGGIEANAGTTHLDRTKLVQNSTGPAPGNGGALHLTGTGTVRVERSRVGGNAAGAEGGGLWNSATGTMTVSRSVIVNNRVRGDLADQGGGGLFNDGGSLSVGRSKIKFNRATGEEGSGGGILNNLGTLTVERTEINGNRAPRAGGGIEANEGVTELDDVRLSRNRTGDNPGNGGGLHLTGTGTVTIDDSTVVQNSAAAEGGGLWNSATGTMTVTDTIIRRNRAPEGPNVFNDGGVFTIDGQPVPPS